MRDSFPKRFVFLVLETLRYPFILSLCRCVDMTAFTDNAPDVFAAVFTLAVFACLVFPLRLYIRLSKKGAWGYDDWCMSVGFVSLLAMRSKQLTSELTFRSYLLLSSP